MIFSGRGTPVLSEPASTSVTLPVTTTKYSVQTYIPKKLVIDISKLINRKFYPNINIITRILDKTRNGYPALWYRIKSICFLLSVPLENYSNDFDSNWTSAHSRICNFSCLNFQTNLMFVRFLPFKLLLLMGEYSYEHVRYSQSISDFE